MFTLHLSCEDDQRPEIENFVRTLGFDAKFVENWTKSKSKKPTALLMMGLYAGHGNYLTNWVVDEYLKKKRPVVLVHWTRQALNNLGKTGMPLSKIETGELQCFTWNEFANAMKGLRSSKKKIHGALNKAMKMAGSK